MIQLFKGAMHNLEIYDEIEVALERQYSKEKTQVTQEEKLKNMIQHAFSTTKFYKKKYEGIVTDNSEITLECLSKLPILEKEEIKENFFDMISDGYDLKRCMRNRTSGSTGKPVINLQDVKLHNKVFKVNYYRERAAWGVEGLCNILMIVPKHFRVDKYVYPDYQIDQLTFDKIWQVHPEEVSYNYEEVFDTVKPDIIYGNPHLLLAMARDCEQAGVKMNPPKIIISSFEMLDKASREYLERIFCCNVYDVYGFSEIGDVAWQCPIGGEYHINDDYVVVEVVNDKGQCVYEEAGDIVVTSLYNYPMPIIRYRTGDKGILSRELCSCGRKTSILRQVLGRNVDFVTLPSGRKISPYELMDLMNKKNIKQFQIVQNSATQLIVKYVSSLSKVHYELLRENLKDIVNDEISVTLEEVEKIESEPSGKFKVIKINYEKQERK